MTVNCHRLVAVLIVLLLTSSLAPTAPAGPPGEQSASALPTNLAAAATWPWLSSTGWV
jgi:polar amino acid transport system substrate-binding protein